MEKQNDHSATDLEFRLEQLEPKIKRKALALAKGIISVYGLNDAHALEEGIIRAKKFYGEKRSMEIRMRTIGAN